MASRMGRCDDAAKFRKELDIAAARILVRITALSAGVDEALLRCPYAPAAPGVANETMAKRSTMCWPSCALDAACDPRAKQHVVVEWRLRHVSRVGARRLGVTFRTPRRIWMGTSCRGSGSRTSRRRTGMGIGRVSAFYMTPKALALAEDTLRWLMERRNSLSGVQYAQDATILALELCNEPRQWRSDDKRPALRCAI